MEHLCELIAVKGLFYDDQCPPVATVAQLVEQLTCNQQVGGSKPSSGFFRFFQMMMYGSILAGNANG